MSGLDGLDINSLLDSIGMQESQGGASAGLDDLDIDDLDAFAPSAGTKPPINTQPMGTSPYPTPPDPLGAYQNVSMTDTLKSNINGMQPEMGMSLNPLDGVNLGDFMDNSQATSLGGSTTTHVVSDADLNPYNCGNFTDESASSADTAISETKKWAGIAGAVIVGILVLVFLSFAISARIKDKAEATAPDQITTPAEETPIETPPPAAPTDSYTGPRLQTATPEALAMSDQVFEDMLSITKQIQVENGSVECYFIGTPKHFGQKVKVPVTIEEYNQAKPVDIVKIEYRVVRISGKDYIANAKVIND